MKRGTPLRKFGTYQVTQPHRGTYSSWAVYDAHDNHVCYATVRESAYYAAEKLARGLPLVTPKEKRDYSVTHYPSLYPCRLRYYDSLYLSLNGDWINGGLSEKDVTNLTPEGEAHLERQRKEREKEEGARYAKAGIDIKRLLEDPKYEDLHGPKDETTLAAYRDGTWPDVLEARPNNMWGETMWGYTKLYPVADDEGKYTAFGALVHHDPKPTEEWLEDARVGMKLLLSRGTVDMHGSQKTLEVLNGWVDRLTTKYGGAWKL